MIEPSGIYLHLPFCAQHCSYCTFTISTDLSKTRRYLEMLGREIEIVAAEGVDSRFDTVYLGGGTPSILPADEIGRLLEKVRSTYRIDEGAEISLEANPDDVSRTALLAWKRAGVTRVSIGIQSLRDRELSAVGRLHTAGEARRAREESLDAGLQVSCDLILGLPDQDGESFRSGVEETAASGVGHVSVYILELDKALRLAADRQAHSSRYLSDDAQAEAYLSACSRLRDSGFVHYEISNWGRPGCFSRHNAKYWARTPTLGFGVSAHELWGGRRRANSSSLTEYLGALEARRRPTVIDQPVSGLEALRETIVLSARTREGIDHADLEAWFGLTGDLRLSSDWQAWTENGLIERGEGRDALTDRGFLLSNEVLCRFI